MAELEKLVPLILHWEGTQFTDDLTDRGGATKAGVTFNTFKPWFKKTTGKDATIDDLKELSIEHFTEVLNDDFWKICQGDLIKDQQVANNVVDWFWSTGTDAIKKIQSYLKGPVTGNLGDVTLANINRQNPQQLCNAIADMRIAYYNAIIKSRPNQVKYKQGWINRANSYRYKAPVVA